MPDMPANPDPQETRRAELRERIAKVTDALRTHGHHPSRCAVFTLTLEGRRPSCKPCDCGLHEALKAAKELSDSLRAAAETLDPPPAVKRPWFYAEVRLGPVRRHVLSIDESADVPLHAFERVCAAMNGLIPSPPSESGE